MEVTDAEKADIEGKIFFTDWIIDPGTGKKRCIKLSKDNKIYIDGKEAYRLGEAYKEVPEFMEYVNKK